MTQTHKIEFLEVHLYMQALAFALKTCMMQTLPSAVSIAQILLHHWHM